MSTMRDKQIAKLVRTTDMTMVEIGRRFGMTSGRISRIAMDQGVRRSDHNEDRDTKITTMLASGDYTLQQIGDRYGVTRARIRQIGVQHGVYSKRAFMMHRFDDKEWDQVRDWHLRGMPISHIADAIGCTSTPLVNFLTREGLYAAKKAERLWTAREDRYVLRHYKQGKMSASAIGDKLGRTRNEVIGRAGRMGLCRPTKASRRTAELYATAA